MTDAASRQHAVLLRVAWEKMDSEAKQMSGRREQTGWLAGTDRGPRLFCVGNPKKLYAVRGIEALTLECSSTLQRT